MGADATVVRGQWITEIHRQWAALDEAIMSAVRSTETPALDRVLVRLSDAADNSKLWLVTAGAVAVVGGRRGRRAAVQSVAAIGVASVTSNLAVKALARRQRPDAPAPADDRLSRHVRRPTSSSFPSGHAASAFAFASTMGEALPPTWIPLHLAATLVGYARVHTGVHYPSDVVVGALVGALSGRVVRGVGRAPGEPSGGCGVRAR
jgi:undecaprenyl-diphosphatase